MIPPSAELRENMRVDDAHNTQVESKSFCSGPDKRADGDLGAIKPEQSGCKGMAAFVDEHDQEMHV